MQSPFDLYVNLLISLIPFSSIILLALAAVAGVWLIAHVEYSDRFSLLKTGLAVLSLALLSGFGIHLLLNLFGL